MQQGPYQYTQATAVAHGKQEGDDAHFVGHFGTTCMGIVCDGVGSARAGRRAARRAVNYLKETFQRRPQAWSLCKTMAVAVENINRILYRAGMEDYEHPEFLSTLAMVVVEGDQLCGVNVGDSPVYLIRDNSLIQLSRAHVSDQPGMEHVLTQALGAQETVEPFFFTETLLPGDRLLLCSDGLTAVLSPEEMAQWVHAGAGALLRAAEQKAEGRLPDDTTVVTCQVQEIHPVQQLKQQDLAIPEKLAPDDIIDGYRLIRSLIQNDRTWLADKNGRQCVLKFAPVEARRDERILDAFVHEAWNANRIEGRFFPKAWIPEGRTARYYVMEYIHAPSLRYRLDTKQKPLKVDDAIALGCFLLRAEQFLLGRDLVHGDLKPENILLVDGPKGREYKLIDFGSIVEVFSTISRAGTPSYLAPERFEGAPISESTEIFATGVVLYEALTRQLPYGEVEPFQTPTFKRPKPVRAFNRNVPAWLEAVIMKAIEVDPERRYGHYSEMLFDLTHPDKVKPHFDSRAPLLERNPLAFYKWGFWLMLLANIALLVAFMHR
ncbi:bifunctional protein-serine/threonine kinase/phosphatase [Sulfurivirga sp.]|uniref:bifunctional protein-serine/threonine kinase/phosphatase n=1 Tax=Sulfurivirga sp. TaxID=2614236 RepID=UPI0025D0BA1D|nr:bifunctional protein-serine/threonine kinase/phosphatase [Sulfurivirga sp.]